MITTQQFVEGETTTRKPNAPISVRLARGEAPSVVFAPIDGEAFVREVFDGVVGDVGPFLTVDAAESGTKAALESKIRRPLSAHEAAMLGMYVVLEFNRRCQSGAL